MGAGAAALAFIGVGANASFTDSATGSAGLTTGTIGINLYSHDDQYTTDGVTNGWDLSNVADTVAGSANFPNAGTAADNGFALSSLTNIGSQFKALIPVNIQNNGTLAMPNYSLTVADANASASSANKALAKETTVTFYNTNNEADALAGTASVIYSGALSTLEGAGSISLPTITGWGPMSANQSHWVEIILSSPAGGYDNAAEGGTFAPTFTATGSDA
jgi:hypothetical protein